MKLKKIFERSMYYFEKGYSFTATPFAFLGYASSIYYLAIQNIPVLKDLFPRFSDFLFLAVLTLPLLCGLVGYFYMKRSWLFKAEQEINMESNPYAYRLTVGINTVLNKYQVIGAEMNLLWWKKTRLIYSRN